MAPQLEPMVGRYLRTDIDGIAHRLYFEEAGEGIPLVCPDQDTGAFDPW